MTSPELRIYAIDFFRRTVEALLTRSIEAITLLYYIKKPTLLSAGMVC